VSYSVQAPASYYVQDGIGFLTSIQLNERWNVGLSVDRQRLSYRARPGVVVAGSLDTLAPQPTSRVYNYGSSLGYRLGANIRLSLTSEYNVRTSSRPEDDYDALRILSSFTYGS
jgi:hypothetical protein